MKVFVGVCLILGSFLGAGFVSGREIGEYFARFGNFAIMSIVIASILLGVLIFFFLHLSLTAKGVSEFSQVYFGRLSGVMDILFAISLTIISGAMLAGTKTLANESGVNPFICVLATIVLAYIVVRGNVNAMGKVNALLVPLLIVVILVVAIPHMGVGSSSGLVVLSAISGVNYVMINIVTLGVFLLEIGCRYSTKEKVLIAIISSLVIGIVMMIETLGIIGGDVVYAPMPILELASQNMVLCNMVKIAVYIGLFTTLISCILVLARLINKVVKRYDISIIISIILSWLVSGIGFEKMVGYVYSVIGVIGCLMVIVTIAKSSKNTNQKSIDWCN